LYVLERAFSSTHPGSEQLFQLLLDAYAAQSGGDWLALRRKLDEGEFNGNLFQAEIHTHLTFH
jgi:tRNA A-37 threonylcarbamoyl transferase component Bud32